jgi:hypothetical protein
MCRGADQTLRGVLRKQMLVPALLHLYTRASGAPGTAIRKPMTELESTSAQPEQRETRSPRPAAPSRLRLIGAGQAATREDFAADVRAGLTASPKSLPCEWFYDREGSLLFE